MIKNILGVWNFVAFTLTDQKVVVKFYSKFRTKLEDLWGGDSI